MTVPPPVPRTPPTAFPPAPQTRTLRLPAGATLTGTADLPASLDDQCQVAFNLMLQLGPFLGSMECMIRVLKALGWVMEFMPLVPEVPNPAKTKEIADKLLELPPIAADVIECVTSFAPPNYCPFIKDLLQMIHDFLLCMLDLLESVATQKLEIGIQMGDAQGNPELLEVLEQAEANADQMGLQGLRSCEPAFAILESVGAFISALGGGAIELPSIDDLAGGEIDAALQPLRDVVTVLAAIISVLPC